MNRARISFFALSILCASSLAGRVALKREVRSFDAGRLSGQAEAVFKYMAEGSEKKKEVLGQLGAAARQLALPDLGEKIDALRTLTGVQLEQNNAYALATAKPLPKKITAELSEGDQPISFQDIRAYGLKLITNARAYTDLFSIPGVPSIAEHRLASFTLFGEKMQQDKATAAQAHEAVLAHKKMTTLLGKDELFVRFLNTFKAHMRKRYDFAPEGLEAELLFKIFENLTYGFSPEADLGGLLKAFIATHNGYVSENMRFNPADLGFPVREWGRHMLAATLVQFKKQVLFALSLAMEGIKKDVKREPLVRRLKEEVRAHTQELQEMLAADEVVLSPEQAAQPLALALRCSEHVQQLLEEKDENGAAVQAEKAQRYITLVDGIHFLMKDYDTVACDMADAQALARARSDMQRVPESERAILTAASSLSVQEQGEELEEQESAERAVTSNDGSPELSEEEIEEFSLPTSSGKKSGKVAAIVTAILVVIAAAALWKFKDKIGGFLNAVFGKIGVKSLFATHGDQVAQNAFDPVRPSN